MRQPTRRTLALVAVVGWTLAALGIGGLLWNLWNQSQFSSYAKRLEEVSAELIFQIPRTKRGSLTIAALPFADFSGRESQLGLFLADHLSTELRRQGPGIQLVDRLNLEKVLEEHELSISGATDPAQGARLGRFSMADTLMVGRIDLSGNAIILDVSLVDVETARRMASSATTIVATNQMQRLWNQPIPGTHAAKAKGEEDNSTQGLAAAASEGSAFSSLVRDFLVTNWPWIWTVLFVPVLTWFVAVRRQSKGKGLSENSPQRAPGGEESA